MKKNFILKAPGQIVCGTLHNMSNIHIILNIFHFSSFMKKKPEKYNVRKNCH